MGEQCNDWKGCERFGGRRECTERSVKKMRRLKRLEILKEKGEKQKMKSYMKEVWKGLGKCERKRERERKFFKGEKTKKKIRAK